MVIATSFDLDNDKSFQAVLDRLARTTSDFRIPFNLIGSDWYKSNRKIFTLRSKGLYEDLADSTKIRKIRAAETLNTEIDSAPYPILVFSGRLANSILGRNNKDSVFFAGRKSLVMGTETPYGKFHQSDEPRTKIPQRKFIFIDGGPNETAKDATIAGRSERWANIVNDYILKVLESETRGR